MAQSPVAVRTIYIPTLLSIPFKVVIMVNVLTDYIDQMADHRYAEPTASSALSKETIKQQVDIEFRQYESDSDSDYYEFFFVDDDICPHGKWVDGGCSSCDMAPRYIPDPFWKARKAHSRRKADSAGRRDDTIRVHARKERAADTRRNADIGALDNKADVNAFRDANVVWELLTPLEERFGRDTPWYPHGGKIRTNRFDEVLTQRKRRKALLDYQIKAAADEMSQEGFSLVRI